MTERNPKIAAYRVLKVIRRCAIFQVALGFAQLLPSQFARIPGQRFQPSARGTMDRSFHRRVPNQLVDAFVAARGTEAGQSSNKGHRDKLAQYLA